MQYTSALFDLLQHFYAATNKVYMIINFNFTVADGRPPAAAPPVDISITFAFCTL